ncbi:hypothetical protein Ahy_B04g070594 isoform D [Arachis hypogaea]|uniref:Aminotransferase-like plant mobile domain-containing protein n=1 Tax=Arachis hypogaea TaxID=3818 RepID=A0A444ZHV7_ARAHY|nr:hypothetical protein Ahy_B04g070594 isoform D [Arachis hypogaea]
MPFGECTITLQDVAYQLGLPVDGRYVSGCLSEFHIYIDGGRPPWVWFQELLGVIPPPSQVQKYAVNCTWFQETFGECPEDADDDTVRRYVRAYIMMLLGTQLFADKSGNRIHIRWLPYVARLEELGTYSWGSAALAWLYRCMCRVANRHVVKLAGPLQLLQSWIFWRFPQFRPTGYEAFSWPLASRWAGYNPSGSEKGPRVRAWRLRIDRLQSREFIWMPYSSPDVLQVLHPEVLEPRHMAVWRSVTALIYFAVIEWHQIDRTLDRLISSFSGGVSMGRDFGSPRFLDGITTIMQGEVTPRRAGQTSGIQAPLDVDLNEPPSSSAGQQFRLGGTPTSAFTAASESIATSSAAPLRVAPPVQPTPQEEEDEIEDEEPLVRRGQRARIARRCGTG